MSDSTHTTDVGPAQDPGPTQDPDLLALRDLRVSIAGRPILKGLDLTVRAGRITALVGESGSGKSMTALATIGLAPGSAQVTGSAKVGNLYVNRNMVGAVVGVQPFGGEGLSGTGPKAGGPLYLGRLVARPPVPPCLPATSSSFCWSASPGR